MNNLIDILKNNGVLIYPTDTVYGLGTILNKKAIEKIYKIKKRDENKKIIALVSNKEKIKEIIETTTFIEKIIDKFFPGEITIIAKAKDSIKNLLNYEYIGVRMPKNTLTLELIEKAGALLMTTSANFSGKNAAFKFDQIDKELLKLVDGYIINDENLSGKASSIFKIENDEIIELRSGNVNIQDLLNLKEDKIER